MQNSGSLTPSPRGKLPAQSRARIKSVADLIKLRAKHDHRPDFIRKERKRPAKPAIIEAYDLETSRIETGTPRVLYLTLHGADRTLSVALDGMGHLAALLIRHFLAHDRIGTKYVAWNANRFDAYFIAAALVLNEDYLLTPYLTRSKSLRGLRVSQLRDSMGNEYPEEDRPSWEFLDGIAMLGLAGVSLEKFLRNFAPDHLKLVGTIDFEREQFDANNPAHVRYAERDSEGLWHGMQRAQSIMLQTFNEPLAVTMGGVCIKIFRAHIPHGLRVKAPVHDLENIIRRFVLRGGFCYCVRPYTGPVWKYDINQAYAAAMRDAALPAGECMKTTHAPSDGRPFIARIKATHDTNEIPFYYRTEISGMPRTRFDSREIHDTWITSIEFEQLTREGWNVRVLECWAWAESFNMADYVRRLETLRTTAEGGTGGPIGTMVKATGNHSYGKTLEAIEPVSFIVSANCPPGAYPYFGDGGDPIDFVYWMPDPDRKRKDYHQPHIGAFITAHVRMVLRRVALLDPGAWLYADTDCVVFSCDMSAHLEIDGKRYGAWKIEEAGTPYRIIAKKVYQSLDDSKRSAKGLNVKRLSADDFARWAEGEAPRQTQTQLNNFLSVLVGADMYRAQVRHGTAVLPPEKSALQAPEKP